MHLKNANLGSFAVLYFLMLSNKVCKLKVLELRFHLRRMLRFQTKFPNETVYFLPNEMHYSKLKTAAFAYHVL